MAYGKLKVDTLTWDNSGTDTNITVSTIPTAAQLAAKAPLASPTFTGTAVFNDLTVNGTNTVINTTTLQVEDKNLELGKVSTPSDTTADGGGITLKGATDKTFNWVDANDAWTSSEHIHVGDNKKLYVGTGKDIALWHDGTNSYIENTTNNLFLKGDAVNIRSSSNEQIIETAADGAVTLYHNNSAKIATSAAGVTVTGTVSDSKGDVRKIIQNTQGSTYTLVAADAGKHILASGTVTIPNNVFAAGDAITIINNTAGDLTLTDSTNYLYNTSDAATGNRTLAARGMATILFTAGNTAYISGAGLS